MGAIARLTSSVISALVVLTIGGVFNGHWRAPILWSAVSLFLVIPALRVPFTAKGKWQRLKLPANLAEIVLAYGLMVALKLHLPEGPRFLLEPFLYPFLISQIIFTAWESGRSGAVLAGVTAVSLRLAAVLFALSNGVIFTRDYAYLDRFVFWGQEIAWFTGLAVTTLAGYWKADKAPVRVRVGHSEKAEPVISTGNAPTSTQAIAPADKRGPEIRTGFLIFVDIRDFQGLTNTHSPGQIRRLLREYHDRFDAVILRNGGTIENREGDGILAHFGIHKTDPVSAKNGMTCLEQMLGVLDHWNEERAGQNEPFIECGFAGVVANFFIEKRSANERLDLKLVGESVNLIQNLEKHNKKIQARASTTRQTIEMAAAQGFVLSSYVRSLPKEKIDNLAFRLDIVVLAERAKPATDKAA